MTGDGGAWALGVVVTTSGLEKAEKLRAQRVVRQAGGDYSPNLSKRCTHVLTRDGTSSQKLDAVRSNPQLWPQAIVSLDWLSACEQSAARLPAGAYAPKQLRADARGPQGTRQQVFGNPVSQPFSTSVNNTLKPVSNNARAGVPQAGAPGLTTAGRQPYVVNTPWVQNQQAFIKPEPQRTAAKQLGPWRSLQPAQTAAPCAAPAPAPATTAQKPAPWRVHFSQVEEDPLMFPAAVPAQAAPDVSRRPWRVRVSSVPEEDPTAPPAGGEVGGQQRQAAPQDVDQQRLETLAEEEDTGDYVRTGGAGLLHVKPWHVRQIDLSADDAAPGMGPPRQVAEPERVIAGAGSTAPNFLGAVSTTNASQTTDGYPRVLQDQDVGLARHPAAVALMEVLASPRSSQGSVMSSSVALAAGGAGRGKPPTAAPRDADGPAMPPSHYPSLAAGAGPQGTAYPSRGGGDHAGPIGKPQAVRPAATFIAPADEEEDFFPSFTQLAADMHAARQDLGPLAGEQQDVKEPVEVRPFMPPYAADQGAATANNPPAWLNTDGVRDAAAVPRGVARVSVLPTAGRDPNINASIRLGRCDMPAQEGGHGASLGPPLSQLVAELQETRSGLAKPIHCKREPASPSACIVRRGGPFGVAMDAGGDDDVPGPMTQLALELQEARQGLRVRHDGEPAGPSATLSPFHNRIMRDGPGPSPTAVPEYRPADRGTTSPGAQPLAQPTWQPLHANGHPALPGGAGGPADFTGSDGDDDVPGPMTQLALEMQEARQGLQVRHDGEPVGANLPFETGVRSPSAVRPTGGERGGPSSSAPGFSPAALAGAAFGAKPLPQPAWQPPPVNRSDASPGASRSPTDMAWDEGPGPMTQLALELQEARQGLRIPHDRAPVGADSPLRADERSPAHGRPMGGDRGTPYSRATEFSPAALASAAFGVEPLPKPAWQPPLISRPAASYDATRSPDGFAGHDGPGPMTQLALELQEARQGMRMQGDGGQASTPDVRSPCRANRIRGDCGSSPQAAPDFRTTGRGHMGLAVEPRHQTDWRPLKDSGPAASTGGKRSPLAAVGDEDDCDVPGPMTQLALELQQARQGLGLRNGGEQEGTSLSQPVDARSPSHDRLGRGNQAALPPAAQGFQPAARPPRAFDMEPLAQSSWQALPGNGIAAFPGGRHGAAGMVGDVGGDDGPGPMTQLALELQQARQGLHVRREGEPTAPMAACSPCESGPAHGDGSASPRGALGLRPAGGVGLDVETAHPSWQPWPVNGPIAYPGSTQSPTHAVGDEDDCDAPGHMTQLALELQQARQGLRVQHGNGATTDSPLPPAADAGSPCRDMMSDQMGGASYPQHLGLRPADIGFEPRQGLAAEAPAVSAADLPARGVELQQAGTRPPAWDGVGVNPAAGGAMHSPGFFQLIQGLRQAREGLQPRCSPSAVAQDYRGTPAGIGGVDIGGPHPSVPLPQACAPLMTAAAEKTDGGAGCPRLLGVGYSDGERRAAAGPQLALGGSQDSRPAAGGQQPGDDFSELLRLLKQQQLSRQQADAAPPLRRETAAGPCDRAACPDAERFCTGPDKSAQRVGTSPCGDVDDGAASTAIFPGFGNLGPEGAGGTGSFARSPHALQPSPPHGTCNDAVGSSGSFLWGHDGSGQREERHAAEGEGMDWQSSAAVEQDVAGGAVAHGPAPLATARFVERDDGWAFPGGNQHSGANTEQPPTPVGCRAPAVTGRAYAHGTSGAAANTEAAKSNDNMHTSASATPLHTSCTDLTLGAGVGGGSGGAQGLSAAEVQAASQSPELRPTLLLDRFESPSNCDETPRATASGTTATDANPSVTATAEGPEPSLSTPFSTLRGPSLQSAAQDQAERTPEPVFSFGQRPGSGGACNSGGGAGSLRGSKQAARKLASRTPLLLSTQGKHKRLSLRATPAAMKMPPQVLQTQPSQAQDTVYAVAAYSGRAQQVTGQQPAGPGSQTSQDTRASAHISSQSQRGAAGTHSQSSLALLLNSQPDAGQSLRALLSSQPDSLPVGLPVLGPEQIMQRRSQMPWTCQAGAPAVPGSAGISQPVSQYGPSAAGGAGSAAAGSRDHGVVAGDPMPITPGPWLDGADSDDEGFDINAVVVAGRAAALERVKQEAFSQGGAAVGHNGCIDCHPDTSSPSDSISAGIFSSRVVPAELAAAARLPLPPGSQSQAADPGQPATEAEPRVRSEAPGVQGLCACRALPASNQQGEALDDATVALESLGLDDSCPPPTDKYDRPTADQLRQPTDPLVTIAVAQMSQAPNQGGSLGGTRPCGAAGPDGGGDAGGGILNGATVIIDRCLGKREAETCAAAVEALGGHVSQASHLGCGAAAVVCDPSRAGRWLAWGAHLLSPRCLTRLAGAGGSLQAGDDAEQAAANLLCFSRGIVRGIQCLVAEPGASQDANEGQTQTEPSAAAPAAAGNWDTRQARRQFVLDLKAAENATGTSAQGLSLHDGPCERPSAPLSLLEHIQWAVTEPVGHAQTTSVSASFTADDAGTALFPNMTDDGGCDFDRAGTEHRETFGGAGARSGHDPGEARQLQQEEWDAVVFEGPRLTLLLPQDEQGILGHHAVTVVQRKLLLFSAAAANGSSLGASRHPNQGACTAAGSLHTGGGITVRDVLSAIHHFYREPLGPEEMAVDMAMHPALRRALQVAWQRMEAVPRSTLLGRSVGFCGLRRCSRVGTLPVYELQLMG